MSFESDEKKLKKGMEVVEKLNFLSKAGSAISDDFRAHTIENLFGTVWARPGLEIEERSMITLASLIALNRENELKLHFRGEIIFHLAHYAGWPNAVSSSNVLAEVWQEMDEEKD